MKHKTIELVVFVIALIGIGTALVMVYQNRKLPTPDTSMVSNPTATPNMTISPTSMVTSTNAVPTEYQNFKAYEVTEGSKAGWKKVTSEKYKVSFEYPENPFYAIGSENSSVYGATGEKTKIVLSTKESETGSNLAIIYMVSTNNKVTVTPPIIEGATTSAFSIKGQKYYKSTRLPKANIGREQAYQLWYQTQIDGYNYTFSISVPTEQKFHEYSNYLYEILLSVQYK